jgi:hypothetical protein
MRRLRVGRGVTALALSIGAMALAPLPAGAAKVEVTTESGTYNNATLRFVADPGESNTVSVVESEGDATELRISLFDEGGGMRGGPGCAVRSYQGSWVTCFLHRPHPLEYTYCGRSCALPIEGTGWNTSIAVALGDGDNSFGASSLHGVDQDAIDMVVTAGDGNDTIVTAEGEDRVEAGAGADQIHTNGGSDRIVASAAPDGPDLYDLGSDLGNAIDYGQRTQPVLYSAVGEGDDGAPGEGDTVRGATAVLSGSGDDVLSGGPGNDIFVAGEGNDRLSGSGGDDDLNGEDGDNLLSGEEGNDTLAVERLSPPQAGSAIGAPNRAEGGPGDDYMYMAAGADLASGGAGNDVFRMGGGDDVAAGGPGIDRIYGDRGDDLLAGEGDGDRMVGDEGSDRLLGGDGDDQLVASVIAHSLPNDPFRARGQLDGWRDRVACGRGSDSASLNPWDVAAGCERVATVRAVGLGRLRRGESGALLLPVLVRGPGRLLLTAGGVRKQVRTVTESRFGRPFFREKDKTVALPIRLSGASRRALRRHGQLRLRIGVRFFPRDGVPRTARKSFLLHR